jgi:hypothetical protein
MQLENTILPSQSTSGFGGLRGLLQDRRSLETRVLAFFTLGSEAKPTIQASSFKLVGKRKGIDGCKSRQNYDFYEDFVLELFSF